jgi:hypothetical protein
LRGSRGLSPRRDTTILDFGLPILIQSEIQNDPKSKIKNR